MISSHWLTYVLRLNYYRYSAKLETNHFLNYRYKYHTCRHLIVEHTFETILKLTTFSQYLNNLQVLQDDSTLRLNYEYTYVKEWLNRVMKLSFVSEALVYLNLPTEVLSTSVSPVTLSTSQLSSIEGENSAYNTNPSQEGKL